MVSPTSSDAGGVPPSAGEPIRGLSLKDLRLFRRLGRVKNLQQLGLESPPANGDAGGVLGLAESALGIACCWGLKLSPHSITIKHQDI